jgi:hypothetical protein
MFSVTVNFKTDFTETPPSELADAAECAIRAAINRDEAVFVFYGEVPVRARVQTNAVDVIGVSKK